MFSRDELTNSFASIFVEKLPPLEYEWFTNANCRMIGGEDSIEIVWGLDSDFRNALHFWVSAFRTYVQTCYVFEIGESANSYFELLQGSHPDFQRDLEEGRFALCRSLSLSDYISLLMSYCPSGLAERLGLSDSKSFVAAMQMVDEWNYIVILAKFKDELFYIKWSTGA